MVAAFADLQVGIVLRRQLDADFADRGRQKIDERIVRLRQMLVHRRHHLGRGVRSGHREHFRMRCADERAAVLGAEAAGDDDLAVFGQCLADRGQRLGDRGVDEAAGIDDHQVGAFVARRDRVTLGGQPRQDLLGVDQRLRAAERDEAHARRRCGAGARTDRRGLRHQWPIVHCGNPVRCNAVVAALRSISAFFRRRPMVAPRQNWERGRR